MKGEQENLIFRRRKVQAKRSTDVDMKASFHGMLRENPKRKFISAPAGAVLQVISHIVELACFWESCTGLCQAQHLHSELETTVTFYTVVGIPAKHLYAFPWSQQSPTDIVAKKKLKKQTSHAILQMHLFFYILSESVSKL